jgi:hypothetical protein
MKLALPDSHGRKVDYVLKGQSINAGTLGANPARIVYSAAHVVADPFTENDPTDRASIDWQKTLEFRHYLSGLGLGIAEAMDTAQRGMGLDWTGALELIKRTREDLPNARVANGCGTDHLNASDARSLDDVIRAYLEQVEAVQKLDARIILMASRALVRVARSPADYIAVYDHVLGECDHPVILHWLGDMFDAQLKGYWGSDRFEDALETALEVIVRNVKKVDGIKISLLDKNKEIIMRRRLPEGIKMYTGDDFHYPELIAGDSLGYSHALLGIFDPLAPAAAHAVNLLGQDNIAGFHAVLDPTVPLSRLIFRAPTQFYKTGVVFLAWLNGFQDHFIMLGGAQAMRPLPYFCDVFRLADQAGVLREPDLAIDRMRKFLAIYGA